VAVGLARTITRPVLALQVGAARFGRGEEDLRLPETAHDELGDLACEFNRMAAAISEREAALHRWAHIFKHAEWGIAVSDSDRGKLDLMNPAFARMYGYTVEELSGRPLAEICTPEAQAEWREHLQLAHKQGHHTFESMHIRKEGAIFPVLADVTSVKDEQGRAVYLAVNIRDITERKREEEEKSRNQERAERLAKEMAVIAEIGRVVGSTLDINQVFERVNAEVRKLIPYDRLLVNLKKTDENEFVVVYAAGVDNTGRRLGDSYQSKGTATRVVMVSRKGILIQPADAEEIKHLYPNLYATFKTGLRSTMSVPLISLDEVIGAIIFRSKKLKAYTEQDLHLAEKIGAQIAGAIVNAQLFNDLTKTEKSLRESEERFRGLFENSLNAVALHEIVLDQHGSPSDYIILMANAGFEKATGLRVADVLGKRVTRIYPGIEKTTLIETYGKVALTGEPATFELFFEPNQRHYSIVAYQVGKGRFAAVFEDVTVRKRAEQEKHSLEMRLNRAEKMEALGQLAGGVAHDLNNVLGVSTIYSELLQEKIPSESPLRKYVDNILSSTQKGAAIIQDLLTLARRGVMVSDVMNLNTIVSNFLKTPEFEKTQAHHPQVTFHTECQAELLNIKGSPLHLEKTLMNLVSNAVEAIPGKGDVTIRTENRYLDKPVKGYDEVKEGDYAVLTVSDTGMGIPAESIGKIFEPFYTKKTMGRSGTGLGLAIVWGTVKDHQGYIDLHTEVGEGTAFTLYFPVTREEVAAQKQTTPIERYMGEGESVLVVDDIAEQRDVAARLLTRLGYRVHAVASGEEAVEYLAGNRMDILVLDMIMPPGIDGLETYRRVLEINPKQKAIIVSGFAETERVKKAQELGAGAYVRKPYLMEGIGLAIRGELSRQ
ncbi:MAG: PAS domain S-box protein, partial [Syntrophales bacterium]